MMRCHCLLSLWDSIINHTIVICYTLIPIMVGIRDLPCVVQCIDVQLYGVKDLALNSLSRLSSLWEDENLSVIFPAKLCPISGPPGIFGVILVFSY